ncbi:polyphosphate kinase 2 [Paraglaciecola aquimarina]|uniref:ADP/GDP-polyphosphate phosphotransferase n=1 Tax=Paraglaciecola aquimarina TaxID=1235557 RepID=A0ABU3SZ51_9ALTE|nr:polyphosphate kinase 2 [Paraglaciecola aquimarina]MDU0355266.1 polyphosphate kinase 2 [Paraglaciecola aquimarina]
MKKNQYQSQIIKLQTELVYLQEWVQATGAKVVVIFEGRDAAGKGGVIKTITSRLNPRVVKVVALGKPTEKEQTQWYFQRYVSHLPAAGEIILFDRSWYNRAGVEKVMGFCSDTEYQDFLKSCPQFEAMLIQSGITLIKYWFSVSQQKQEKRFLQRLNNPLKRWKFSDMDLISRSKWNDYSAAKDQMLKHTDTPLSPWYNVDADDKKAARINCISHLLSLINYQPSKHEKVSLPDVPPMRHQRPAKNTSRIVPNIYKDLFLD